MAEDSRETLDTPGGERDNPDAIEEDQVPGLISAARKGGQVAGQWRRLLPALAVSAAISVGVVAVFLAADSDDGTEPAGSHSDTSLGGVGGGPEFIKPSRVTEGDWEPPGVAVAPSTDRGPYPAQHVGEVINGIRIVAVGEGASGRCPGKAQPSDLAFPFEASYLPPNTFAMAKPQVLACPDGSIESAHLMFQIGGEGALAPFSIDLAALDGEPVAIGTGDVSALEINGQNAVGVAPEKFNGVEIGTGSVVIDTATGSIAVVGTNMPLAELEKIAAGVNCAGC